MTCGIYKLNFNNTDKVYIGKSKKIEFRYTRHLESFRNSTASKRMMEAYRTYGIPSLEILCETSIEDLDKTEAEAIEIFDSVLNGFNSLDGIRRNNQSTGENASNHLYDNDTYSEILKYLALNRHTHKYIAELLEVSQSVVTSISKLENHVWLESVFPEEYKAIKTRKDNFIPGSQRTAEKLGIEYPCIISPEGVEYKVTNVRGFATEHGFASSNLHSLLVGKLDSLYGWVRKGYELKKYPKLIHTDGTIEEIPYRGAKKFADKYNLNTTGLSNLLTKKREEYNGWKLLE